MENSPLALFEHEKFGSLRVIEHKGEPWFVARDVCAVLGTETRDLPDILEHDEQRPIVDIIHTLNDSTGLRRDSRIISEPGLYSLILRSRKPEAKAFKRWVTHEVIPSIRRSGAYVASTKESPRSLTGPGAHAIRKLRHIPDSIGGGAFSGANVLEPGYRKPPTQEG